MGFHGNKSTWCNNWKAKDTIFTRLHRALVNYNWLNFCPDAILFHLPVIGSNHAPTPLNMTPRPSTPFEGGGFGSFLFEPKWLLHSELFDLVKGVWFLFVKSFPTYQLNRKIRILHSAIKSWNKKRNNNQMII